MEFLETGSAAVQVATRFTVTRECGLPDKVKQEYFKASEEDIEVNLISPTGYPMRMLKEQPRDRRRHPSELRSLRLPARRIRQLRLHRRLQPRAGQSIRTAKNISVMDKTCLCTHMRNFDCWTCGHYTYRLKDTSRQLPDGSYQILTAEHVFNDYRYSVDHQIALPAA